MRDAILAAKVDDNQQRDSSSTSDNTLEQFLRCYNELLSLTQSAQENENEEMYEEQIGKESNADSASDRESSRSSTDRSNRRRRRQEKRSKDQKDDGRREEGRRRRFESNKALDREIGLTFEQAMLEAHAILNMQVQQVRELATLGDWLGLFRWQGGRKELENSQAQIQIKNHLSILDDPYTPFPWKDQRLFEQTNGGEFNCPLCSSFIWPFSANYSTVQSSLCQKHSELIEKMKGELELMEQKDLSTVWLCRIASCVCEQIVRTDEIFFSEIQKLRMNTGKKIRKRIISEGKGLIVTNSINKLISKSSKDSDTKQGKHSSHSSLDGISIAELAQSVLKKNTLEPTDARQFLKDSKHLLQKLQDYAEKEVNDIHQLHASRGMMKDTKEEMIEDNQKTANELVDEFLQSVIQLEVFNEETLKARINKQENENKQIAQFMKEKIMNETKRTKEEEREKRKQLAMEQTKKDKNEEKKKESDIIQHVQVNIKQEEVGSKQIKQTGEDLEEGEERDPDADMQVDIPQKESLNVSESEESGGENIGVQKDEAGLNIQGVTNDETGIQMLISDENSSDSSEESSEDEDINSEEEKKINKDDGSKNKNEKDKIKRSKKVKRKRKHSKSSSSSSSDSNDRKHRHKRRKGDHHKKSHRHRRGSRARDAGYGTKRRRFNDSDETPARELEEGEVEEGEILD
ncbi:MAG: hypothetical protein EZS28_000129 [Streblomastix strix]|uniref:Uncharacterized protein n=1 Tax=Streblomastix strix TaxID=222440 RepID=A0A5J4XBY0_9EUKA|nr:MAG: hypothetical protein EZS28_000129 [Streblomastix strix]